MNQQKKLQQKKQKKKNRQKKKERPQLHTMIDIKRFVEAYHGAYFDADIPIVFKSNQYLQKRAKNIRNSESITFVGSYYYEDKTVYINKDIDRDSCAGSHYNAFLVHEFTHAMQCQKYPNTIYGNTKIDPKNEKEMARFRSYCASQTLAEGQAMFFEWLYLKTYNKQMRKVSFEEYFREYATNTANPMAFQGSTIIAVALSISKSLIFIDNLFINIPPKIEDDKWSWIDYIDDIKITSVSDITN